MNLMFSDNLFVKNFIINDNIEKNHLVNLLYKKYCKAKAIIELLKNLYEVYIIASINQHDDINKCFSTIEKSCNYINQISRIILGSDCLETSITRFKSMIETYKQIFNKKGN